jgi:glycine/D-amino acid oxidase-like deaminating enzyme
MTSAAVVDASPFWQAGRVPARSADPLPAQVDALIIGGGYTGLSAARETAAAGLSTLVLEAGRIGAGCSGRNGGQVAYSLKPSFHRLSNAHGAARAHAICREAFEAIAHVRSIATQGGADCDWQDCGGFYGAHTARHFERMAHDAEHQPKGLEQRISVVPKAEQRIEIATDYYHGGCIYHDDASVDPMKLLIELLRRAREQGAAVADECRAESIRTAAGGFEVLTNKGVLKARKVLIATNGYSGALSPWHQRRVIPIGSYQICTERIGASRVRELIPKGRCISDSRRVVVYYRPSADGERLLFGGRAALSEQDPLACVGRLKRMMTLIFPQLGSVGVDHAWVGWVAYTFDTLPHLGEREGVYYCMGYCGQGVPTAPYFGMRIGQQMAGLQQGRTSLDGLPFPTRPYYGGTPWFLAPSVWAYRTLDALGW